MLYSYYLSGSASPKTAEKELFFSIEKTYDLFHLLLLLMCDVTNYAATRIEKAKNKYRPTEEETNPNTRFIDNRFVKQLQANKLLVDYVKQKKLTWINNPETIKSIYDTIVNSEYYTEYMNAEEDSYKADKDIWRKIFKKILLYNEELETTLEELSVYWNDDIDIVISFILKVIKRFEEENGDNQPLLPMFKDEDDKAFASKLFIKAIADKDEYRLLIEQNAKNWDVERIAFMDIVIMQAALAELMEFANIPVNVTLNEYIEIAKTYSTERSNLFINGVLDNIVSELKKENKLIKAVLI